MSVDNVYHQEVLLRGGTRDLAALKAALGSPWKDYGMGLLKKEGFANRAKCTISDDGGYITITFEGEQYIPSPPVSDEAVVPIGADGGVVPTGD